MKQIILPSAILFILMLFSLSTKAQCPENIGFEKGNLDKWTLSTGTINRSGQINLLPVAFSNGQHQIIKNSYVQEKDPYGNFPVNCPNGSGYSVQLGNDASGGNAESMSYTFTIPADKDEYSIIYNYAVVIQNPDHSDFEQPKFTARIFDVSKGGYIGCSSFEFVASLSLPGFKTSKIDSTVLFKAWSPVTIKLSGRAGTTIRIEFTTNDCSRGGHFGYAYIDVDENCASPVSGNIYCPNDTKLSLTAPYGFAGYRWFNSDFSQLLSTENPFTITPPLPAGTKLAVEVTPYPELGCIDTIFTTIAFSPNIVQLAVKTADTACAGGSGVNLTDPVITTGSAAGLSFRYYTDALLTNFAPAPDEINTSGVFYIKATNTSGCTASAGISITILPQPPITVIKNSPTVFLPATFDLSTNVIPVAGVVYTYWQDALFTKPVTNFTAVDKSGIYYVKAAYPTGCANSAAVSVTITTVPIPPVPVPPPPPAVSIQDIPNVFSPNGDGINDAWEIPVLQFYPGCMVDIYDRSGRLLFRSVGYQKPWDGKYNGAPLPLATYYYLITSSEGEKPVSGSVTILK